MPKTLKVLIVDDSRSYQFLLSRALEEVGNVTIVGKASNGNMGLRMLELYKPDLITLDVEMPIMNGLETLKRVKEKHPEVEVIMVSALTIQGAQVTLKALEAGAFDFIGKPSKSSMEENHNELRQQLAPKLQGLLRKKRTVKRPAPVTIPRKTTTSRSFKPRRASSSPVSIVGLGISTGGPNALKEVIPEIPADFKQPILIVQHMPPMFTKALADSLNQRSPLTVVEATHGETVKSGTVYIAPGGKQMKIRKTGLQTVIVLTDDPPEKNCKPSVDYLFRSLANQFQGSAMGVIMTGMGNDGTLGLKLMKRYGSYVIAQDEATSTVFGMPMEAIKAGVTDETLPLNRIADGILRQTQKGIR